MWDSHPQEDIQGFYKKGLKKQIIDNISILISTFVSVIFKFTKHHCKNIQKVAFYNANL